jgi:quercetin dioxygenase-like cupin family protein
MPILYANLIISTPSDIPGTIIVSKGRDIGSGNSSVINAKTSFTGTVWADATHSDNNTWIGSVFFSPGARSFWHKHEQGQLLTVVSGSGWVCDFGGKPRRLSAGDVSWSPPGTIHWHGADDGSFMVHNAIALGKTQWMEEVKDGEYAKKDHS